MLKTYICIIVITQQKYIMNRNKAIAQKRYSINDAIISVPARDFKQVVTDIARIMGLKNRLQLIGYRKGIVTPGLGQAQAVEEYFKNTYGITNVWKVIDEPILFRAPRKHASKSKVTASTGIVVRALSQAEITKL